MPSPSAPLFRFGVVADPQYAAIEPNLALDRYSAEQSREGLPKRSRNSTGTISPSS